MTIDTAKIRALVEAATPGPGEVDLLWATEEAPKQMLALCDEVDRLRAVIATPEVYYGVVSDVVAKDREAAVAESLRLSRENARKSQELASAGLDYLKLKSKAARLAKALRPFDCGPYIEGCECQYCTAHEALAEWEEE